METLLQALQQGVADRMEIFLCNVRYHTVIHWLANLHILFRQKNKEFWLTLFCYYHILFTCEFTEASINPLAPEFYI